MIKKILYVGRRTVLIKSVSIFPFLDKSDAPRIIAILIQFITQATRLFVSRAHERVEHCEKLLLLAIQSKNPQCKPTGLCLFYT